MGRRKKSPAKRMYFAGYLHPDEDEADRELWEWYQNIPKGKRFPTLLIILRSGGGISMEIPDEDAEKAENAVDLIMENFLVD